LLRLPWQVEFYVDALTLSCHTRTAMIHRQNRIDMAILGQIPDAIFRTDAHILCHPIAMYLNPGMLSNAQTVRQEAVL
jgi:hypothetical protein